MFRKTIRVVNRVFAFVRRVVAGVAAALSLVGLFTLDPGYYRSCTPVISVPWLLIA